ncbi:MAG: DUF5723 family protein [Bacteroidia bacterium]
MKNVYKILVLILWPFCLQAQIETTLPSLTATHQATYINPAILPTYSTSFSVPGVIANTSFNFIMNGFNARTILNSVESDSNLSIPKFYDNLKGDKIEFDIATNIELFHVRFKSKKWYYGFNLNTRTISNIRISKEFIGLAAYGNDYYAGSAWDVSNTSVTAIAFNELGFSMSRNYDRFNIGARAKLYHGIGVTQTNDLKLKLNQPKTPTEEVGIVAGGVINTSSLPLLTDSINGRKATDDEKSFTEDNLYTLGNLGAGIDLGVTYDVNNRLTVGASVVDFGFINWTENVYNYGINDVDVRTNGLNKEQLDNGQKQEEYFDSLFNQLKPTVTNKSFTTFMPWRFYLTANYNLNKRNTLGAIIQGRYLLGSILPAYTLSYAHKFGDGFHLTANYSIIGNSYANVGLGWSLKMGPVHWYLVQDNILAYFNPDQFQVLSFRMGLNLVFNEIKRPLKVY